jgi:hypothetical protein
MSTDRRRMLEQRDKAMRIIWGREAPQVLRNLAQKVVDNVDAALSVTLEQRDKAMRIIQDPEAPQVLRNLAQKMVDNVDGTLGLAHLHVPALGTEQGERETG